MALLFGYDKNNSLSDTGFTMQGDINMLNNKITNLPIPTSDTEPVTKKFADDNYSGGSGTGLKGDKGDTGSQGLKGNKGDPGLQGLKGDKGDTGSQGSQGLKGNKGNTGAQGLKGDKGDPGSQGLKGDTGLQGLKGNTGSGGLLNTGFTMQGNINMGGFAITNLPTPTHNDETVTKTYVDKLFVKKTKLVIADWSWGYLGTSATYKYPYRDSGWPATVRTDELSNNTNIVLRHVTFDNELTANQILACTIIVSFRYHTATNHYTTEILDLPLTGKTVLTIPTNLNTPTYTLPLEEEYWLGNLGIDHVKNPALAFTVKIKVVGHPVNKDPEVICSFRLNESGQYG